MSDATQPAGARSSVFRTVFLDHPDSVNETFWQHFRFAMGFSFWLFCAAMAALVHALVPVLFETTASTILKRLHTRVVTRAPH